MQLYFIETVTRRKELPKMFILYNEGKMESTKTPWKFCNISNTVTVIEI